MKEIYNNLYVGNQDDYEEYVKNQSDWAVVHACKEPYHRQALGYTGRAALKTHPEYLIAKRDNRLILNLIDVDNSNFIPKEIIDEAIKFIHQSLSDSKKVLVHCNQGQSRSPSIGMLYLALYTNIFSSKDFNKVESEFRKIYPLYSPAKGIRDFISKNWNTYINEGEKRNNVKND